VYRREIAWKLYLEIEKGNIVYGSMISFESALFGDKLDLRQSRSWTTISAGV
jgi:hypothetical protein